MRVAAEALLNMYCVCCKFSVERAFARLHLIVISSSMQRAALALSLFLLPSLAAAESAAETLARWGLVGTWARDCAKPVSGSNGRFVYAVRDGKAVHLRDFGDELRDENEILSAQVASDGSIELRVDFPKLGQVREYALIKSPDGGLPAKFNRGPDGKYSILDGKLVHNGAPAPKIFRCR